MSRHFQLFGELRVWHFVVPTVIAYTVPLGFFVAQLCNSAGVWAAIPAVAVAILLVRRGCRIAPRPLQYGSVGLSLLLAGAAVVQILLAGVDSNYGAAYTSFLLAYLAAVWRLGAKPLFLSLGPVWILASLFLPFVGFLFESASLEVWKAVLIPASRALDFCLVPNEVSDVVIQLTGGRTIAAKGLASGLLLNSMAIPFAIALLRHRSVFIAFLIAAANVMVMPVLTLGGVILQGVMVSRYQFTDASWFVPLLVAVVILLLNLVLQGFAFRESTWIWQENPEETSHSESIFEGCDFTPALLLVLVVLILAGLGTSYLLAITVP
jgi:hypothetical protein